MADQQSIQNDTDISSALTSNPEDLQDLGYGSIVKPAVSDPDLNTLSLLVDGIYCAACIQKIETGLKQFQGVKTARLNFSSGALNVEWVGAPSLANRFVLAIQKLGYKVRPYSSENFNAAHDKEDRFLLLCLGVAGFAMGNIMLLSIGLWITTPEEMGVATRDLLHLISALIAIPTIFFAGRPFFRSAYSAIRSGRTNMDVPISVGVILATGISLFETFNHGEHAYFDSAVMLIFFLLIGRYLDFRARRIATSAAHELMQSLDGFASVIESGGIRKIPIRDIRENMILQIAAGEKFPADSVVISGQSSCDTSLVTGETLPVDIFENSKVFAGTINLDAPIKIKVIKQTSDSLLADIIHLMEKAEQNQSLYVKIADKAAALYTPVVHSLALLAFVYWFFIAGLPWQPALMIAATVLIITCPCALGLAVPVVQVLAISRLMKKGILVKSGDALERLAKINTIIFDKTGTLTEGKPILNNHLLQTDSLCIAASIAAHSKHVLAQALASAYTGPLLEIQNIQEFVGSGMVGHYNNKIIKFGKRSWCEVESECETTGPELWLNIDNIEFYKFTFNDEIRPDADVIISKLQKSGFNTVLLSGDRNEEVKRIAEIVGIQTFYAEKSPTEKFEVLESLKHSGNKVLMVGDGLNDAPVLAGADVAMAPGSAIDLTQNAADIVFLGKNLSPVLWAINTAKQSQILVRQNFIMAIIYNIFAIPLAFFGYVTPLIAALAMSGSSILVVANSFRLKVKQ